MSDFQPEKRAILLDIGELRVAKKDAGGKVLVGYAAKFGKLSQNLGGFVEKIDRNAFERCLERCDVRGLKNHDPAQLLGRTKSGTMRLSTDDVGLRYEIDLPETQVGRDTATEVDRGDLDGSSFSFTTEELDGDEWDRSTSPPTRTVRNVRDLFDVGPVTYPAYLDSEVKCRSFDKLIEQEQQSKITESRKVAQLDLVRRRIRLLRLRLMAR